MKLAGSRSAMWALFERFEIPNYDGEGVYLTRWRIVQTPWFALYLHRFTAPDPRPTLHDHPWSFVSVILRGGYVERRLNPLTLTVDEHRRVRRVNVVRPLDAHAIVSLDRTPTWSLLFVGKRRRKWGYMEPAGDGWTWTPFDRHRHNDEFLSAISRKATR